MCACVGRETYTYTPIIYLLFFVAEFSILLPCAGKGIAQFGIGLMIESRNGIPLNGTPLRFRLRKECSVRGECVSRAHDHHLFARTYSSVSAVIRQPHLLPHALLIVVLKMDGRTCPKTTRATCRFTRACKIQSP